MASMTDPAETVQSTSDHHTPVRGFRETLDAYPVQPEDLPLIAELSAVSLACREAAAGMRADRLRPEASVLPTIDGDGLGDAEQARLAAVVARVHATYRRDMPDAGLEEVRQVTERAAHDALRAVLRDRPRADTPSPGFSGGTDASLDERSETSGEGDGADTPGIAQDAPGAIPEDQDDNLTVLEREIVLEAATDPDRPASPWPGLLTLAELVEFEAVRFESWRNQAGDLLAGKMRELAQEIRWCQAETPRDFEARQALWDQWAEEKSLAKC